MPFSFSNRLLNLLTQLTVIILPLACTKGECTDNPKITQYLSTYHSDFKNLTVEIKSDTPQKTLLIVTDSEGLLLKKKTFSFALTERKVFNEIASIYLFPNKTTHLAKSKHGILAAWYWDYKIQQNPAFLDYLAEQFNDPKHIEFLESSLFWKYLCLYKQHGGRKKYWKHLQDNPQQISQFLPQKHLSHKNLIAIIHQMDHLACPILSVKESHDVIRALSLLTIKNNTSGKKIRFDQLSYSQLSNKISPTVYQQKINRIKNYLTRINPLFLNALRSLGISYEHLLDHNIESYRLARDQFTQDLDFARTITISIQASKSPKP